MSELLNVSLDEGRLRARYDSGRIFFRIENVPGAVLHWGLQKYRGGLWGCPPPEVRPPNTQVHDAHAARTPLPENSEIAIPLPPATAWQSLAFVIHLVNSNRWIKDGASDFVIELPSKDGPRKSPKDVLIGEYKFSAESVRESTLSGGAKLAWASRKCDFRARAVFVTDAAGPLYLHWGLVSGAFGAWTCPPKELWPAGTLAVDEKAVRSPFDEHGGLRALEMCFAGDKAKGEPAAFCCVFFQSETGRWMKADERDLVVPIFQKEIASPVSDGRLKQNAETIIRAEMEYPSWTLMHRFNLCHDLLNGVERETNALALYFVWLRYSALRQLDWQRSYNTKPRELSHSQDRLTLRLASIYRQHEAARSWIRLLFTTMGPTHARDQHAFKTRTR